MEHVNETPEIAVIPADPKKIKKIWMVTGLLALVTSIEYIIAFTVGSDMHMTKAVIFILLTLVKAFYIVSEFMHLGHEKKGLVYAVIVPYAIFIGWAIVAFLMEGNYIGLDIADWY